MSGKFARLALSFQEFDYEIFQLPGKANDCADAFSKNPVSSPSQEDETDICDTSLLVHFWIEPDELQKKRRKDDYFGTVIAILENPQSISQYPQKFSRFKKQFALKNNTL